MTCASRPLRWIVLTLVAVGLTGMSAPVAVGQPAAAVKNDRVAKCRCAVEKGRCCGSACCRLQSPPPLPKPVSPATARDVRTQPIAVAGVAGFAIVPNLVPVSSTGATDSFARSALAVSLQSQAVRLQV